jgi:cytochrome c oxidase subunit 3
VVFGLLFLFNQMLEFYLCPYTISWFSFTSIFFVATGFHGFHVLLGLILLFVGCMGFFFLNYFHYVALGNCIFLYWHFVDVIWLFLFSFAYIFIFYLYSL